MSDPNQNQMQVTVRIEVRQETYGHGQLTLNHTFSIRADSFSDIANVLQRYDELSKSIESLNKR